MDQLSYPDEFRDHLKSRLRGEPASFRSRITTLVPPFASRRVAVVFALGTIVRGRGGPAPWTRGGLPRARTTWPRCCATWREEPSVAAVVLRIDSPGGSALASDLILREVERLKKKKPVVVSMSDEAASGGYYIAARASRIVAEPATLTGSIGIFGGKLVTRRFEEEILGLGHDVEEAGRQRRHLLGAPALHARSSEAGSQRLMDRSYETFLRPCRRGPRR